ncbi:carbohydrate ABC transporter permease [Agrococcus baldri]|uniref:Sugar ABC transporter permease n=1 Tax=Agrococcus baldri TaxID=153730 RepID=A0AA87R9S7_9MICO|nr:carbohydrate ABC transporter permease [Agrococcus baldri]GEK79219.1 sugar ABC transporter permease [Agrococcus baldri]
MNRYTWRTGTLEVLMIVLAAVFAIPFYVIVNVAFQEPHSQQSAMVPTFPPNLESVGIAWFDGGLGAALINSALVTVVSSVIVIAVSSLASYYIARAMGGLSRMLSIAFIGGLMLPLQLATLPLYVIVRNLGLMGTIWGLVLVYSALFLPFSIFLYTMFLRSVPMEFEESAQIDGCGPLTTFWHVVFPLVRPVTVTVLILNGIGMYNDFFTPLLYLSGSGQQTVTVAITSFVGVYVTQWPVVFSGLLLASIPVLIAFIAAQKQIIGGFAGGLKG